MTFQCCGKQCSIEIHIGLAGERGPPLRRCRGRDDPQPIPTEHYPQPLVMIAPPVRRKQKSAISALMPLYLDRCSIRESSNAIGVFPQRVIIGASRHQSNVFEMLIPLKPIKAQNKIQHDAFGGRGMSRLGSVFLVISSFSIGGSALADPSAHLSPATIPQVQCVHRVLKSSKEVQSVSLYSIDDHRFAVEFEVRNQSGQVTVSDIEFIDLGGSLTESDKIPRGVSMATSTGARDLEAKLHLISTCNLETSLDNLRPQPKSRAEWRALSWPGK